jgi:hypothetical protein
MVAIAMGASLLFCAIRLALTTTCCSSLLDGCNEIAIVLLFLISMVRVSKLTDVTVNLLSEDFMVNFP